MITSPARSEASRPHRWARDPGRRPRWWLEALAIVWLLWVYDAITNLPAMRERAAMAHGLAVLHLEQRLHLDPERALNQWLSHHSVLGLLAGDYYDNLHFVVTFGIIGWLWWRHPRRYRPLRTSLVLINVIGFIVFWLYPMAPPRLLPGQHFSDTVAITHAFGGWHSGALSKAANQFASMPSLHLAWASWSAFAVWTVLRRHRSAALVWLYPIITAVIVMATANHYLADCVAGVATMAVATVAAMAVHRRLDRTGPDADNGETSQEAEAQEAGRQEAGSQEAEARDAASSSARTGVVNTPIAGKTAHTTKAPA